MLDWQRIETAPPIWITDEINKAGPSNSRNAKLSTRVLSASASVPDAVDGTPDADCLRRRRFLPYWDLSRMDDLGRPKSVCVS